MQRPNTTYWIIGLFIFVLVFVIYMMRIYRTSPISPSVVSGIYNVRMYGAKGDGKTIDTIAINKAIDAANSAGGGTVHFPAGSYLSVSIHLKSNITLQIDSGATIIAAERGKWIKWFSYDPPEKLTAPKWYQDRGHTYFHNSLIWGENLENVSIVGAGRIWGKGLQNNLGDGFMGDETKKDPTTRFRNQQFYGGEANKAIALKSCRNITIRDVSFLHAGHFAILATGVDNLTIDNVRIDTGRDGIDIDCCQNVHISNCLVNTPRDDAICLKSSFALNKNRSTQNVTIINCQVSGFKEGTLLNGTFVREKIKTYENVPIGRIKLGTESNGGFKAINISNCLFIFSQGIALESVDGGVLEDISISNIIMQDVNMSPLFLRLGRRLRGPTGISVGALRNVNITNITVYNAESRYPAILSGIPDYPLEDIHLSNIHLYYKGRGVANPVFRMPPEAEDKYPDSFMFGEIPCYGFFIRHVSGLIMHDISVHYVNEETRPPFLLYDVTGADFWQVNAQRAKQTPTFIMKKINNIDIIHSSSLQDTHLPQIKEIHL